MSKSNGQNGDGKANRGRGRPTDYTPELGLRICLRISMGETLTAICKEDAMPCRSSVLLWTEQHPEFSGAYARARHAQSHYLFEEAIDTARQCKSKDDAAVARMQVDTYFRAAGKLNPKQYGDSTNHLVGGEIAVRPAALEDVIRDPRTARLAGDLVRLLASNAGSASPSPN